MANILLSFDTEEFDVPREQGLRFTLAQAVEVSVEGTRRVLDVLRRNDVRATFFCTGLFAVNAPEVVRLIDSLGHEVACHGVDHWQPRADDPAVSKRMVEGVTGGVAAGYRSPRMQPVAAEVLRQAGYKYNSSLNPTFIPGHYMNLLRPRTAFWDDGVLQIPASVTPWLRLPLFWLSLHLMPQWLYHWLVRRTAAHDGYFATYLHPWEFYDLKAHPELRLRACDRRHSGWELVQRLDALITMLKKHGHQFITYGELDGESFIRRKVATT